MNKKDKKEFDKWCNVNNYLRQELERSWEAAFLLDWARAKGWDIYD